ncbi:NHS-like protein 1 isoform X3 [Ochotona princeps]|uniref:NHS-like protein 1 isoform X3 n=1 Tax=Ochotona princeps TaxID=9978 RepID=UPI002714809D|nr:NHS-like protein 1 isoform X3 [Ochotona princeps]
MSCPTLNIGWNQREAAGLVLGVFVCLLGCPLSLVDLDAKEDEKGRLLQTEAKSCFSLTCSVSNLDEESRWTVHYTAPWHQQENVFLPSTRPPCVEDLHRQAKLNLKSVLRECDKLRHDGYRSSQYYSQGPTFAASSSPLSDDDQDGDADTDHKYPLSSSEEERHISIRRPKTPTSGDFSDLNTQTNWTRSLPLPTPEEKMRQQAQTVQADVVPINITGENFDRQASLRRSLIYTDTLVRRPKKVKRRKTITGVPDNIQKELASGTSQEDVGDCSVYAGDHCSTLGRLNGYHPAGQRSETRDSSCQTEDVKVVPPSVRRIRAYKGQGIAAQMSHFSGSSGNMSVLSDSAGVVFPSRLDGDAGFHSLPRSAVRTRLQSLGALGPADEVDGTLPYQRGRLQGDENLASLGGFSRTGMLLRPRSEELRPFESENLTSPACVVSPHATYSTSIIPNATLSCSSEIMVLHTAQSAGQLEGKMTGSSPYLKVTPRDHFTTRRAARDGHQLPGDHWSDHSPTILSQAFDTQGPGVSLCDSEVPLGNPVHRENGSHVLTYHCRNNLSFPGHTHDMDGKSESSSSGGRASGPEHASPLKPHPTTPGHSSPTSNLSSCSLDQTSNREDGSSVYSEEHNCYPLRRTDSALGSSHVGSGADGFGNPRHSVVNVFDGGRPPRSQGDRPNDHDKSLSRNISLRKAKKPPLPPSRTDSLRRAPKKNGQSNGQVLNESLIATLQHSLQLNLPPGLGGAGGGSSPSHSPCSDLEESWLPRSRSQSTVSAGSSLTSATTANVSSMGGATPAPSDTSSVKSEYADPWCYYIDYTGLQEDTAGPGVPAANGPVRQGPDGARAAMPPPGPGTAVKPKVPSPEKCHRVTSPSSGYSSQSNTPTTLTPVPVFLKSASPANGKGKAKPKVPERKSSLISSMSISSSSTSLSSNASTEGSGTVKRLEPALASPPALPPHQADRSLLPPPPPTDGSEEPPLPLSPVFPPPPPEALMPFCSPTSYGVLPPPPPPLSPLLPGTSASLPLPPPAPPLDPKFMRDPRPAGRPEPSREALKSPSSREEGSRPPMPLITTEALQMVQLRPVRRHPSAKVAASPECAAQEQGTPASPPCHLKPSAVLKARNSINEMESESQPASETSSLPTPARSSSLGDHDQPTERGDPTQHSPGALCSRAGQAGAQHGPGSAPLPDSSPSRKPPPISKKPKLFLVVPPPQRDCAAQPAENVSPAFPATPSPSRAEEGSVHSQGTGEISGTPVGSHVPSPGSSLTEAGAAGVVCPSKVETDVPMVQPNSSPTLKQDEPAESNPDDGGNAESCLSQQDQEAVVPEASPSCAASEIFDPPKEEGSDEVMTPSRPRTTEDLFAAIHRSKRKVLGRKDSDEEHSRNHSPSPPVTPTGSAPSLSSPKQVGSIQRSVRKSSTSSDNFKALLLRKGSRSDTGARMSAAEMLKHTDPRFQRSRSEPAPDTPESPSSCSPSKNRRAQEEWAKNEGLMPRSLSFSGPRYGRSRAPPSAASSRYSMRNRIQSSPMTVISEGEGEGLEITDPRARHPLGTAKGHCLDGLAGDAMDQGSLARGVEPTDGTTGAEGGGPPDQREES